MEKFNICLILVVFTLHGEATQVFPEDVTVVSGEEIMLRLENPNENQTVCFVTTPHSTVNYTLWKTGDEKTEFNPRIQYWNVDSKEGECGVRIGNVTFDDEGYWRLTSLQKDGRRRVGAAKVTVIYAAENFSPKEYEVNIGSKPSIHLGPKDSEYCQIVVPGEIPKNHLITGNCNFTVNKYMKNDSRHWAAMVGVRGKVEEIPASVTINIREEQLDVGWQIFNNSEIKAISMYCNLRYSDKRVSFCRFLRLSDQVGFHLSDGLGNGQYSYFGNGLHAGDCGMTIERPSDKDYTLWKCILGVVENTFPMAAFIKIKRENETDEPGKSVQFFSRERVIEVLGSQLTVICQAEAILKYCWIRHPNGTSLFPLGSDIAPGYQYFGRGLQMGDCGITIAEAKLTDSGTWECHMGAEQELVTFTDVKITAKPLAADKEVIKTLGSGNVTMLCQSVPIGTSLVYCRFVRPDGYGFNVYKNVNRSFLGHYSYHGQGLDKGECGLFLHTIKDEDFGQWTCAAQLQGDAAETVEFIAVELPDGSIASIGIGSAAALVLTLTCLLGIVLAVHRNKRQQRQSAREQEEAEAEELELMPV